MWNQQYSGPVCCFFPTMISSGRRASEWPSRQPQVPKMSLEDSTEPARGNSDQINMLDPDLCEIVFPVSDPVV